MASGSVSVFLFGPRLRAGVTWDSRDVMVSVCCTLEDMPSVLGVDVVDELRGGYGDVFLLQGLLHAAFVWPDRTRLAAVSGDACLCLS